MIRKYLVFSMLFILLTPLFLLAQDIQSDRILVRPHTKIKKLYWFIPDGVRADPYLFNIYDWAKEGELPNIKRMMDAGTYGFCKPVYPGHTPVNFATLLTGTYPEVHGISDGQMHTQGHPLTKPSVAGFSSTAKNVEPIWVTLEKQGMNVGILSIPGSTPPELENGFTAVGRWGGWGASFYAVNFEEIGNGQMMRKQGRYKKLFFLGPSLIVFEHAIAASGWNSVPASYTAPKEVALRAWGAEVYAYIYDSTDDKKENFDRIIFSTDKNKIIANLKQGEWSDWLPITAQWRDMNLDTAFKIKIIKLDTDGFFRVRLFFNNINFTLTKPEYIAQDLIENVGPMVDYVDNFPPQLIFYDEDKNTFIEESDMSFAWHRTAASYVIRKYKPDVFIHDIYTPTQMLTSKWWLGYIDPLSRCYSEKTEKEREQLWSEVKEMYKKLDDIIGEYLANADNETVVVFSSDHGAVALNTWVHLNNLFASKGWLKFKIDPGTGDSVVDWANSQVVYLNFGNIYINPSGLHDKEGNWHRGQGKAYEKLRKDVIAAVSSIKDKNGVKPLTKFSRWEDAEREFRLPHERVGDLVVANRPGYGWTEEMSEDKKLFSASFETGYKQAVISTGCPAMWSPFIIVGPGVKKNYFLGNKPIDIVDQYPTLMNLIGAQLPNFVQGRPIEAVFSGKDNEKSKDRR